MVFESLIKPIKAITKPWELFFYGMMVTTAGIFLGYWVFRDKADLVMIFLTVFACIPLMFHALRHEEQLDLEIDNENRLLKKHSRVLMFYIFMFTGMTVAYVLWYVLLPSSMTQVIFKQQLITIAQINAPTVVGNATSGAIFNKIFLNNAKVLIFCILFSFFYGAGAIFILAWNASVVAAAIGNLIKLSMAKYVALSGIPKIVAVLQAATFSFSRYFFHGLPEMIAYMIAGLAGGIISVAVINKDFESDKFSKILLDASTMLLVALGVLFVAAAVETWVTPALF